MPTRLVDVLNGNKTVLRTYTITIDEADVAAPDAEYQQKALDAAAFEQLVPEADFTSLTANMHVSRRGSLAPYGDDQEVLTQTRAGLEQMVREHAHRLWEQDGSPDGRADAYWHRAHDEHLRERAYVLWQQEGCSEGRAGEYWHRTQKFETR